MLRCPRLLTCPGRFACSLNSLVNACSAGKLAFFFSVTSRYCSSDCTKGSESSGVAAMAGITRCQARSKHRLFGLRPGLFAHQLAGFGTALVRVVERFPDSVETAVALSGLSFSQAPVAHTPVSTWRPARARRQQRDSRSSPVILHHRHLGARGRQRGAVGFALRICRQRGLNGAGGQDLDIALGVQSVQDSTYRNWVSVPLPGVDTANFRPLKAWTFCSMGVFSSMPRRAATALLMTMASRWASDQTGKDLDVLALVQRADDVAQTRDADVGAATDNRRGGFAAGAGVDDLGFEALLLEQTRSCRRSAQARSRATRWAARW